MPYIKRQDRAALDEELDDLITVLTYHGWNDGHVNYVITRLMVRYVQEHGLCYKTLQSVAGLLASVGSEFERRVVEPYERHKRIKNGDVYSELMSMLRALAGKGDTDGG